MFWPTPQIPKIWKSTPGYRLGILPRVIFLVLYNSYRRTSYFPLRISLRFKLLSFLSPLARKHLFCDPCLPSESYQAVRKLSGGGWEVLRGVRIRPKLKIIREKNPRQIDDFPRGSMRKIKKLSLHSRSNILSDCTDHFRLCRKQPQESFKYETPSCYYPGLQGGSWACPVSFHFIMARSACFPIHLQPSGESYPLPPKGRSLCLSF